MFDLRVKETQATRTSDCTIEYVLLLMLAVFLHHKVHKRTPPPFKIVNRKGGGSVCFLFVLTPAMQQAHTSWFNHMSAMCILAYCPCNVLEEEERRSEHSEP